MKYNPMRIKGTFLILNANKSSILPPPFQTFHRASKNLYADMSIGTRGGEERVLHHAAVDRELIK